MSHVDIMTYYAAIPSSYERVFCYFSADRLFFYCLFSFCSVGVVMRFGYWESWHAIKVLKAGHLVSCRVCVCVRVYVCVCVCGGGFVCGGLSGGRGSFSSLVFHTYCT